MTVKDVTHALLEALPPRAGLCDDCLTVMLGPRHCQMLGEALSEMRYEEGFRHEHGHCWRCRFDRTVNWTG